MTSGGSDPGGGSGHATNAGATAKGGTTSGPGEIDFGGYGQGGCDPESPTCGLAPGEEAFCSDSRQDPGEACDDGNTVSGDGCTATCAQVEVDFVCPTPGEPCVSTQKCGDKKVSSAETCDGSATRSVVLNADGSTTCAACTTVTRQVGTTPGKVYEIALFHAERQTSASNFKLSLTGFVNKKSQCKTKCGDSVVTGDEECDDGANNGDTSYNGCTKQCKRGPYCGDGNVDAPDEDCDDSVNISKYGGCAPGCKAGPYCGDGIVQAQEACDDGKLAGAYGGCAEGCVLGPRCGDKVVQDDADEGCDDGNHKNLDGCSATCKIEQPK